MTKGANGHRAVGRIRKANAAIARLLYPGGHWRPRTRGECPPERPCPYVACRHNLYADISPAGMLLVAPREPWQMETSCSLDVADRGPHQLNEVGDILGVTRERIRQIEERALEKLRQRGIDWETLQRFAWSDDERRTA